jgi:hypothetical protein
MRKLNGLLDERIIEILMVIGSALTTAALTLAFFS